jgi:hypothetical protein
MGFAGWNGIGMHEGAFVAHEDLINLIELFSCDPNVRPWQTPKIEHPVQHCHRLWTKLAVDILFIDDDRIFRFVKSERKICLTQA